MSKKIPSDTELFRQMMSGVKPLSDKKSVTKVAPAKPRPVAKYRQVSPSGTNDPGFIARDHAPAVAPEEALFFSRGGLQHRLLRQFKRGELRPEAQLDLHGQTIAEAGAQLARFLKSIQSMGLRCICVIHGKGHRSAKSRSVLKTQINQWLRDAPSVLAFSSAQPKDGGTGALYVLLRRPS